jgi:CheY-like chemotaxis protein
VTLKYKILFVDDDPRILQGLQRMLHYMRKDWDMKFLEGGETVLAMLEQEKVDVLVTDMKMPGMDGIQLDRKSVV